MEHLTPEARLDALRMLSLESEVRAEELQEENDRLREEVARAHAEGVAAERSRVIRCRNACLVGLVVDDDVRARLVRFDAMLLRGEDVGS